MIATGGARRAPLTIILAALAFALIGCATTPPPPATGGTTFLRAVDLVEMTDRMAESMAADPDLVGRGPDAPRWIVSMDRITNHTNQLIPDGEKWLYVARLRGLLAQTDFAERANLAWVMPPDRWRAVSGELADPTEPPELRTAPTHQLTGRFQALTTTNAVGRTDTYLCSYQLVDLGTGVLVWEDQWEVKRAATGLTYD